jgi:hypothetical protein
LNVFPNRPNEGEVEKLQLQTAEFIKSTARAMAIEPLLQARDKQVELIPDYS